MANLQQSRKHLDNLPITALSNIYSFCEFPIIFLQINCLSKQYKIVQQAELYSFHYSIGNKNDNNNYKNKLATNHIHKYVTNLTLHIHNPNILSNIGELGNTITKLTLKFYFLPNDSYKPEIFNNLDVYFPNLAILIIDCSKSLLELTNKSVLQSINKLNKLTQLSLISNNELYGSEPNQWNLFNLNNLCNNITKLSFNRPYVLDNSLTNNIRNITDLYIDITHSKESIDISICKNLKLIKLSLICEDLQGWKDLDSNTNIVIGWNKILPQKSILFGDKAGQDTEFTFIDTLRELNYYDIEFDTFLLLGVFGDCIKQLKLYHLTLKSLTCKELNYIPYLLKKLRCVKRFYCEYGNMDKGVKDCLDEYPKQLYDNNHNQRYVWLLTDELRGYLINTFNESVSYSTKFNFENQFQSNAFDWLNSSNNDATIPNTNNNNSDTAFSNNKDVSITNTNVNSGNTVFSNIVLSTSSSDIFSSLANAEINNNIQYGGYEAGKKTKLALPNDFYSVFQTNNDTDPANNPLLNQTIDFKAIADTKVIDQNKPNVNPVEQLPTFDFSSFGAIESTFAPTATIDISKLFNKPATNNDGINDSKRDSRFALLPAWVLSEILSLASFPTIFESCRVCHSWFECMKLPSTWKYFNVCITWNQIPDFNQLVNMKFLQNLIIKKELTLQQYQLFTVKCVYIKNLSIHSILANTQFGIDHIRSILFNLKNLIKLKLEYDSGYNDDPKWNWDNNDNNKVKALQLSEILLTDCNSPILITALSHCYTLTNFQLYYTNNKSTPAILNLSLLFNKYKENSLLSTFIVTQKYHPCKPLLIDIECLLKLPLLDTLALDLERDEITLLYDNIIKYNKSIKITRLAINPMNKQLLLAILLHLPSLKQVSFSNQEMCFPPDINDHSESTMKLDFRFSTATCQYDLTNKTVKAKLITLCENCISQPNNYDPFGKLHYR